MEFNADKFKAANFRDRTKEIPVPQLQAFFTKKDDGEDGEESTAIPVWVVRGLTGAESARARQAVEDAKNLEVIVEALGTGNLKTKIEAIRKVAGLNSEEDVPEDLIRRYSMLTQASVNPVCDYPLAIKIAENFPEIFYLLTNTIVGLTHRGRLGE